MGQGVAWAYWPAAGSGTSRHDVFGSMANATLFKAVCTTPGGNKSGISLSWKASSDAFVGRYSIVRSRNGVPELTIVVNAPGTTYDETFGALATNKNDLFSYTITARVGVSWTTTALAAIGSPNYNAGQNSCA
jgi:hypothetical protein